MRLLDVLLVAGGAALVLLVIVAVALIRGSRLHHANAAAAAERQREMDDKMAELNRASAELAGRMQTVAEVLGSRQSDLARLVSERLDLVGQRVGQGIEQAARAQHENLGKLNERLAVIDAAQTRLRVWRRKWSVWKDILSNKQARGAYGQGTHGGDRARRPATPRPTISRRRSRRACGLTAWCACRATNACWPSTRNFRSRASRFFAKRIGGGSRPRRLAREGRHFEAREGHFGQVSHPRRDAGSRCPVRAVGSGLCRSPSISTRSCRRRIVRAF